jgi:hypothetical protein
MMMMEQKLAFFRDNGYYVEHGALRPEEVAQVTTGISKVGGSSADVFHKTTALDCLAYHRNIFPLAQCILGRGARLSGFNYGTSAATDQLLPPVVPYGNGPGEDMVLNRAWHREDSGNVEGAADNEYFCPAVQAIIYLDDVDHQCHCTSIIPESADTKRRLPKTQDPLLRDGESLPRSPSAHYVGVMHPCIPAYLLVPHAAEIPCPLCFVHLTLRQFVAGRHHDGLLRIDDCKFLLHTCQIHSST